MMNYSGHDMLKDMDYKASKKRKQIHYLNEKITEANDNLEDLHIQESTGYIRLAELRFELMEDKNLVENLSKSEKEVYSFILERRKSRADLDQSLIDNQSKQDKLEEKRDAISSILDDLSSKVEIAENKVLKSLQKDPDYISKLKNFEETEVQITRIENKIVIVKEDYKEKVKPYHDDGLFMYLWKCGYGTSSYNANYLITILDDWVAKVVNYEPARRNYSTLSAIPEKMEDHKVNLLEKMEKIEQGIDDIEQKGFENTKAAELKKSYTAKSTELDILDQEIDALETDHENIIQQKAEFSNKSTQEYDDAITKLKDIYKHKSLHNLKYAASLTATREDDELIHGLYKIDDRVDDAQELVSTYQRSLIEENWKLTQLQNVRKTFKHKKYDTRSNMSGDKNMFGVLLNQFISGVITNPHFWLAVGHLFANVLSSSSAHARGHSRSNYQYRGRSNYSHKSRFPKKRSSGGFRTGGKF